ncbi:MAG: hypothetical protein ACI935_001972 [Moritella dasanensis]|jgi:hypothetical protein
MRVEITLADTNLPLSTLDFLLIHILVISICHTFYLFLNLINFSLMRLMEMARWVIL